MADPVDIADIRQRAERVREFTHEIEGRVFRLRHPTQMEAERIYGQHRDDHVTLIQTLALRSLIDWDRVMVGDALPEAKNGGDFLPFQPATVELVFAERSDWADALGMRVVEVMRARRERIEAARKNSSSGSAGSGPAESATSSTPPDSAG